MNITDFLLARIADDEEAARAAMGEPSYDHFGDTAAEETLSMALSEGCAPEGAAHFRRHYPARVLAECEAKRQIVNDFLETDSIAFAAVDCCGPTRLRATWEAEDRAIRILARPYTAHPDYRDEWSL